MMTNIAVTIRFFRDLATYNRNPEFKKLKRDVFLAVFQNATVSVSEGMPETLRVLLDDRKLFEIEKCNGVVSATIFKKVNIDSIEKEINILTFLTHREAPRNVSVESHTVTNRIHEDINRIQILSDRTTKLYDLSGELLHQRFYPRISRSENVTEAFLQSEKCQKLENVVTIDDLGMTLKHKQEGKK